MNEDNNDETMNELEHYGGNQRWWGNNNSSGGDSGHTRDSRAICKSERDTEHTEERMKILEEEA